MSLTPFTRELGTAEGRIAPTRVVPDQGSFVFALGSDLVGRKFVFSNGDKIQIGQVASAPGTTFVRPRVHLRPPIAAPPVGVVWWFDMIMNGVTVATMPVDRARDFVSLAMNYAALSPSSVEVDFVLRLVAPAGLLELELPVAYVDALLHDTTAGPAVINALPDSGEQNVPRGSLIELDISTDTGSIVAASTTVYVNGAVAYAAGVFQAGWNGVGASQSVTLDGGRTLRLVISPTSNFASQALVAVRVVSATSTGSPLDTTYSFAIEDYTPPTLVAAQAQTRMVVRGTFSEAVVASEALLLANWSVAIVSGPPISWGDYQTGAAVWVNVESVTQVSDRSFDITVDMALTPTATYKLAAAGIHDLHGNVVDPNALSQTFVAIDTRPPERKLQLFEHVPAMNIREDHTQDLRKVLWAWQEPIDLVFVLIDEWLNIIDPDTCPEPFLDAMLADLGNPFSFPLSLTEKRKLVGLLETIYEERGSGDGIVNVIRLFMGIQVTLLYPGFGGRPLGFATLGGATPGTLQLGGSFYDHYGYEIVSPVILTDDQRDKMRGIAEYMQATNEHLTQILEPGALPTSWNHLVLGISQLGVNWKLH